MELVDTLDLGSSAARFESSSLSLGTMGNETMVVTWVRIPPFPKLYGIGATTSIFNRTHKRGSEAVVKK